MAKKKTKLPDGINTECFTQEEISVICALITVFVTKLSLNGDINEKHLRGFSYGGLYEIGVHTHDSWISKLLKYNKSTIAENIIVAHGYVTARFESAV